MASMSMDYLLEGPPAIDTSVHLNKAYLLYNENRSGLSYASSAQMLDIEMWIYKEEVSGPPPYRMIYDEDEHIDEVNHFSVNLNDPKLPEEIPGFPPNHIKIDLPNRIIKLRISSICFIPNNGDYNMYYSKKTEVVIDNRIPIIDSSFIKKYLVGEVKDLFEEGNNNIVIHFNDNDDSHIIKNEIINVEQTRIYKKYLETITDGSNTIRIIKNLEDNTNLFISSLFTPDFFKTLEIFYDNNIPSTFSTFVLKFQLNNIVYNITFKGNMKDLYKEYT
jgi:hypothetical protein